MNAHHKAIHDAAKRLAELLNKEGRFPGSLDIVAVTHDTAPLTFGLAFEMEGFDGRIWITRGHLTADSAYEFASRRLFGGAS